MRAWIAGVAGAAVLMALAGCDNPRRTLGLDKRAPDEFAVVTRAPLTLPPEFSLRPPRPGAPRPQEGTARDQARRVITGDAAAAERAEEALPASLSQGERALLSRAGTDQAIPNIRQVVEEETSTLAAESESFTDRLLFWRDQPEFGTAVDPVAESRRLRENSALGRPPTTGATPSIERREKGILEGLF